MLAAYATCLMAARIVRVAVEPIGDAIAVTVAVDMVGYAVAILVAMAAIRHCRVVRVAMTRTLPVALTPYAVVSVPYPMAGYPYLAPLHRLMDGDMHAVLHMCLGRKPCRCADDEGCRGKQKSFHLHLHV